MAKRLINGGLLPGMLLRDLASLCWGCACVRIMPHELADAVARECEARLLAACKPGAQGAIMYCHVLPMYVLPAFVQLEEHRRMVLVFCALQLLDSSMAVEVKQTFWTQQSAKLLLRNSCVLYTDLQ